MKIDTIHDGLAQPALRDDLEAIRRHGGKRVVSAWTRLDAGESFDYPHRLREVPFVVDVLEATSRQGENQTEATDVTVVKTDRIVTVTNGGAARFFRVRAS